MYEYEIVFHASLLALAEMERIDRDNGDHGLSEYYANSAADNIARMREYEEYSD